MRRDTSKEGREYRAAKSSLNVAKRSVKIFKQLFSLCPGDERAKQNLAQAQKMLDAANVRLEQASFALLQKADSGSPVEQVDLDALISEPYELPESYYADLPELSEPEAPAPPEPKKKRKRKS